MKKAERHLVRAAVKLYVVEKILVMLLKAWWTVYMQIACKKLICLLIFLLMTILERKK